MEGLQDLEGKVVLVTGASSGLGRVFCEELLACGCHVVAAARRTHLLSTLAASSSSSSTSVHAPGRLFPLAMDVTASEECIDQAVQLAWDAFGRIDVLINNAGFRGVWLVSKAVAKRFAAANINGSIINISTIGALERGLLPGASAYASSKAGGIQLTKMMALELGKHNIRVNSIAPGLFHSEITIGLLSQDWVKEITPKNVPMQRNGDTSPDLTSLILLLASDRSSYVTGNTFVVDGGQSIAGIRLLSSL